MATKVSAAERLHAYQSHHVIEPDAKVDVLTGDMIVCAVDGIRIKPESGYWFHDNEQVIALMDVLYGNVIESVG